MSCAYACVSCHVALYGVVWCTHALTHECVAWMHRIMHVFHERNRVAVHSCMYVMGVQAHMTYDMHTCLCVRAMCAYMSARDAGAHVCMYQSTCAFVFGIHAFIYACVCCSRAGMYICMRCIR